MGEFGAAAGGEACDGEECEEVIEKVCLTPKDYMLLQFLSKNRAYAFAFLGVLPFVLLSFLETKIMRSGRVKLTLPIPALPDGSHTSSKGRVQYLPAPPKMVDRLMDELGEEKGLGLFFDGGLKSAQWSSISNGFFRVEVPKSRTTTKTFWKMTNSSGYGGLFVLCELGTNRFHIDLREPPYSMQNKTEIDWFPWAGARF